MTVLDRSVVLVLVGITAFVCPIVQTFTPSEYLANNETFSKDSTARRNLASSPTCIKWGNTFDVPIISKNFARSCQLPDGRPICCEAIHPQSTMDAYSKPIGSNYSPSSRKRSRDEAGSRDLNDICVIAKTYISSPHELRELAAADRITALATDHTDPIRMKAVMDFVLSADSITHANRWLERVKHHMNNNGTRQSNDDAPHHPYDLEYLSRFEITRTCGSRVDKWIEWIEPITVTARHPFSFSSCRPVKPFLTADTPKAARSNVEYVLLQGGKHLFDQTYSSSTGKRLKTSRASSSRKQQQRGQPRHYMLDAGTSTFDSSLFWFTCAYAQRKIGFDQVFAWEMTLLEPTDYWRRVPMHWKPYWHFYNVPISADKEHADSPVRFLQQMATPDDFVALKLDIDSPDYEMPIAMQLLTDNTFSTLVDEFFFELHYRCEVMTSCGWGKKVPAESHGLVLDRPHVLRFFMDLRKRGIRAHIWP